MLRVRPALSPRVFPDKPNALPNRPDPPYPTRASSFAGYQNNYYKVLGLDPRTCTADKRVLQARARHPPDKCRHPKATEAMAGRAHSTLTNSCGRAICTRRRRTWTSWRGLVSPVGEQGVRRWRICRRGSCTVSRTDPRPITMFFMAAAAHRRAVSWRSFVLVVP